MTGRLEPAPRVRLSTLVASAITGGGVLFLVFATLAFAIPGPGGWAAWRVGLIASPFGAAVGIIAYLLYIDDQRAQFKKGAR